MTGQAKKKNQIFLCYRREDNRGMADYIYREMARRFGEDAIFKDVDKLYPGYKFKNKLDEVIASCDLALVVIGEKWAGSEGGRLHDEGDYVRREIEALLRRGIPVIPLVIEGASVPKKESLPAEIHELTEWQVFFIHYDPYFQTDMERLAHHLWELIGGRGEGNSFRRLFKSFFPAQQNRAREAAPAPLEIKEQRDRVWQNGPPPDWRIYLLAVLAGLLLSHAVFFAVSYISGLQAATDWDSSRSLSAALTGSSMVIAQGLLGWLFGVLWPKPGWRWGLWVSLAPVPLFLVQVFYLLLDARKLPPAPEGAMKMVAWILAFASVLMPVAACLGARHGARRVDSKPLRG